MVNGEKKRWVFFRNVEEKKNLVVKDFVVGEMKEKKTWRTRGSRRRREEKGKKELGRKKTDLKKGRKSCCRQKLEVAES